MSIPVDIREIRRKRYELSTISNSTDIRGDLQTTHTSSPLIGAITHKESPMVEDDTWEAVLARVAIYEQDEKLAMDLLANDVPTPIPAVVERLIDSYITPSFANNMHIAHRPRRVAPEFWHCKHCNNINLNEIASCAVCHYMP